MHFPYDHTKPIHDANKHVDWQCSYCDKCFGLGPPYVRMWEWLLSDEDSRFAAIGLWELADSPL